MTMDAVLATIVAGGRAWIWLLHIEVDKTKLISLLINWINKNPMTATSDNLYARPPGPWAAWIHQIHAAAGASSSTTMVVMFVVCLCSVLQSHSLYVKKDQSITLKYTYSPTIRLMGITFWSTHTCHMPMLTFFTSLDSFFTMLNCQILPLLLMRVNFDILPSVLLVSLYWRDEYSLCWKFTCFIFPKSLTSS